MLNNRILIIFIILFLLNIFNNNNAYPEPEYKWRSSGGSWGIANSYLVETKGYALQWNYYELINFNTIITLNSLKDYSAIDFTMEAANPGERPPQMMAFFAATSPYKYYYYHFIGFKFYGNKRIIRRVSLIHSDRKDTSKKIHTKNNFFVRKIASKNYKLKYNKEYNCSIKFNNDNEVALFIDGVKVLQGKLPEKSYEGNIGFSSRNTNIKIGHVKVINEDKTIFEDDFTEDRIKRLRVKGRRVKNK